MRSAICSIFSARWSRQVMPSRSGEHQMTADQQIVKINDAITEMEKRLEGLDAGRKGAAVGRSVTAFPGGNPNPPLQLLPAL